MKNILVVVGSGRKNGNTDHWFGILDFVIKECFWQEGAEIPMEGLVFKKQSSIRSL